MKLSSVSEFVDDLQKRARYTFTRSEAQAALPLTPPALTKGLQRLDRAGRIRMIRRGFYVIVPMEYASGGIVPPDWFIDDLMKFLQQPYYVGVLTAAALYGAGHQQPQEYQVVVSRLQRPIRLPNLSIRFFLKKGMPQVPTQKIKSYTGYLATSTPAATALDLVRFSPLIGGLDTVLTVLEELELTPEDLLKAAQSERELSPIQRLGWLLERTQRRELADALALWLAQKKPSKTPLDISLPSTRGHKDPRWQVIVNAEPQP